MQFKMRRESLQRELALLQEVAAQKNANPILSCVKLEAADEELSLAATDTTVSMFSTCGSGDSGLTISENGIAIVEAKRLHDYVKSMEGNEVALSTDEKNWLHLSCESARFRMQGYQSIDFPQLPEPPDDVITSQLPGIALADLIERIECAIEMGGSRLTLPGAFLEVVPASEEVKPTDDTAGKPAVPATMRIVTTDGHRLSVAARTGEFTEPWTVQIPKKGLSAIASMARSAPGGAVVELSKGSNHVFAVSERRTIASLLLAGQFPAWRNIVNNTMLAPTRLTTVNSKKFRSAASRVVLAFNGDSTSGLKFEFRPDGNLNLEALNRVSGEDAKEHLTIAYKSVADQADDDGFSIYVNHRYLLDFISSTKSDILRIGGGPPNKNQAGMDIYLPLRLTDGSLITDGYQYTYVIMAMNPNIAGVPLPEKPKKEKAEKRQPEKIKPEPPASISEEEAMKKALDMEIEV